MSIQVEVDTQKFGRRKSSEIKVHIPYHDCDVILVFPNGKELAVQLRPSNADVHYNGSLDIILPEDTCVTCWKGDDMEAAPAAGSNIPHERIAKQLVLQLPYEA